MKWISKEVLPTSFYKSILKAFKKHFQNSHTYTLLKVIFLWDPYKKEAVNKKKNNVLTRIFNEFSMKRP